MNQKDILSQESEEFLGDLSIYLFSSGKKTEETEEIVEELRAHLEEAEENGKSVENIIGSSPKEYMESISNEMKNDYRSWTKYLLLIVFGSFSFDVFQDLMNGTLSYSLLEITGNIIIVFIFLGIVLLGFRLLATRNFTPKMQVGILAVLGIFPIGLYVGLIYMNKVITTPVLHFGVIGSIVMGVLMSLFIIGMSIWAETWVLLVVILLLTVPDLLLGMTSLAYENQLLISTCITVIGFVAYFLLEMKLEKRKG